MSEATLSAASGMASDLEAVAMFFRAAGVGEELGEEFGQGGGGEFFFLDEFGGVGVGEDLGVGGLVVVGGVGEGDEEGG